VGTKKREYVQVSFPGGGRKYGYVAEIGQDRFTLIDSKTGAPTEIAYAEVGGVRRTRLTSKTITVLGAVSAVFLGIMVVGLIYAVPRE
jgi:xanthine/uracil permease